VNILATPPTAVPDAAAAEQRFRLDGVAWREYVAIADALPDRPGLRLTYDRGRLEFMTLSPLHEVWKSQLARFVTELLDEFDLNYLQAGSTTFRREDEERGLEPDDCFWIAGEARMRGRHDWDWRQDPPPDLVLEIEVSRSALGRMGIYAALRVPEVWRFDGTTLTVHRLQAAGEYGEVPFSPLFPGIPPAGLVPFLQAPPDQTFRVTLRSFRDWVRQQRAAPPAGQS